MKKYVKIFQNEKMEVEMKNFTLEQKLVG